MDHAVELTALVAHGPALGVFVLACAELSEVFCGARDAVGVEFEFHAPCWHVAYGDVEEDDGIGVGQFFHALDGRFVRHLAPLTVERSERFGPRLRP